MKKGKKAGPPAVHECGGGSHCRKVRARVYRLMGGHMSARERGEVWRHMKSCGRCFSHYEFALIMRNLIREKVTRVLCPVRLARRVRKSLFPFARQEA